MASLRIEDAYSLISSAGWRSETYGEVLAEITFSLNAARYQPRILQLSFDPNNGSLGFEDITAPQGRSTNQLATMVSGTINNTGMPIRVVKMTKPGRHVRYRSSSTKGPNAAADQAALAC